MALVKGSLLVPRTLDGEHSGRVDAGRRLFQPFCWFEKNIPFLFSDSLVGWNGRRACASPRRHVHYVPRNGNGELLFLFRYPLGSFFLTEFYYESLSADPTFRWIPVSFFICFNSVFFFKEWCFKKKKKETPDEFFFSIHFLFNRRLRFLWKLDFLVRRLAALRWWTTFALVFFGGFFIF